MTTHGRIGTAAGAVAGVVALAGALSMAAPATGGAATGSSPVQQALQAAMASGSANISLVTTVTAPGMRSGNALSLKGDQTFANPPTGQTTDVVATSSGTPETIHTIFDGGTDYLQIRGRWYSETTQRAMGAKPGGAGALAMAGNPAGLLNDLQGDAPAAKVGHAMLGKTATTLYRATVDLAPLGTGAAASQVTNAFASPIVPAKVWVDAQGRLRQLVITAPFSRAEIKSLYKHGGPASMDEVFTVTLSDFGRAVHVTPPPAAKVQPLSASMANSVP